MNRHLRLLPRAAGVLIVAVALAGCKPPPTPPVKPTPTPTPAPVGTPVPTPYPVDVNGTNANGQNAGSPIHPVFTATVTVSGAAEGTQTFSDDVTGQNYATCAASAALNDAGIWQVPWFHAGKLGLGGHDVSYIITLTAADHFHGAGVYPAPQNDQVSLDGTLLKPGAFTTLQLNADGSGSVTLSGFTGAPGGSVLSGSIVWTCAMHAVQ